MNSNIKNHILSKESVSIDDTLQKIHFFFRYAGLNFENRNRRHIENCIVIINFLWLNTDVLCSFIWFIIGVATNTTNFKELTYVCPCSSISMLANIKTIYLIINENQAKMLINKLRKLENIINARNLDKEEHKMIFASVKFLNSVIKWLNILNVLMMIVFSCTPGALTAVKYFKFNKWEPLLPFLDVYPFNASDIRYWPFAYLHQVWSECIVLLELYSSDYLFFICCTYIIIQFKLLQYQINRVIPDYSGEQLEVIGDNDLREKIIELVKWHQEIISSASLLEVVYSKSTLFNFLISSLVICLTCFNVTAINDVAFVAAFVTFMIMAMLQIFFFCFFGDLLMSSSVKVADAVYSCNWYLTNTAVARNMLLMQKRAQLPCKLTASGFADVNLRAFMKVLSSAWSYFALLQTLYRSV